MSNFRPVQTRKKHGRPGQSAVTTSRQEADRVEILGGLLDGLTLGTPIAMVVRNKDQRPGQPSPGRLAAPLPASCRVTCTTSTWWPGWTLQR